MSKFISCRSKNQVLFISFSLALFLFSSCSKSSKDSEIAPAKSVKAISLVTQAIERSLPINGSIFANEEIAISAKVPGRIKEVLHDLGDEVPAGAPLLKIDDIDYIIARNTKYESSREALARLGFNEPPEEGFDPAQLPAVKNARLQAQNMESRYLRAKKLFERKPPPISEQEFKDAKTQFDIAYNESELALLAARGQLANARSLYSQFLAADHAVRDTILEAPKSSANDKSESAPTYQASQRLVSVGDYVGIATPLLRLVDPDPLKLKVQIPERYISKISIGQKVAINTEAYSKIFEGSISRVSPAVSIESRAFEAEILIPNSERLLKPGMFARAKIRTGKEQVLLVHKDWIRSFAGLNKILIVVEGKAKEEKIQLGQTVGDFMEVSEGLKSGAVVLTEPTLDISNNTPVIPDLSASQKLDKEIGDS